LQGHLLTFLLEAGLLKVASWDLERLMFLPCIQVLVLD
jgi:hypothetical protein